MAFNDLAFLAARVCETPVSMIYFVDESQQACKGCYGADASQVPEEFAACAGAIRGTELLEVEDACADPRFAGRPLMLGDRRVRFYAAARLNTADGHGLGAICVVDVQPRRLKDSQRQALLALARIVVRQMEVAIMRRRLRLSMRDLRDRQVLLRDIFHNSSELMQSIAPDGRILFVNRTWLKTLGYAAAEVTEMKIFDLIAPESREECRGHFEQLMAGIDPGLIEFTMLARDGRRVRLRGRANTRRARGRLQGTRAILRDVSEEFAAQQIQIARQLVLDRLTTATSVQDVFEALLAHMGRMFTDRPAAVLLVHADDTLQHAASCGLPADFLQCIDGRAAAPLTDTLNGEGGVHLFVDLQNDPQWTRCREIACREQMTHCHLAPIRSSSNEVMGFLLLFSPVSAVRDEQESRLLKECAGLAALAIQRKSAAAALSDMVGNLEELVEERSLALLAVERDLMFSRKQFEAFFEFAPDPYIIVDSHGLIIEANARAEALFGYDRRELKSLSMYSLLEGDAGAVPGSVFFEDISARIQRSTTDIIARRKDGSSFPAEFAIGKLLVNGRTYTAVAARDLTERRLAEEYQLRVQRLESIGNLAGGIAHDLNNALAPILMSVASLRMRRPEESEVLGMIQTSAERGANMVRQLLTFARGMEGERIVLKPGMIRDEVAGIVRNTFPKRIRIEAPRNQTAVRVSADPTQLHQVLLNLCVNSRDAMPDGGLLKIEEYRADIDAAFVAAIPGAHPGSYVVWKVSDTGEGISPKIIQRIFEPYFSTKGPELGTGLGLSTVMGIVRSHGGFVRVYSRPGQGTVFSVYIPVYDGSDPGRSMSESETLFRGNGEEVLVVDDDVGVRTAVPEVLRSMNLAVLSAAAGADGLVLAEDHKKTLRLVISDMHMPDMDGLTFVRALRLMMPRTAVIVSSGYLDAAEEDAFRELGVHGFLEKPYTQQTLGRLLGEILPANEPSARDP